MKKILALLCLLAMLASLCACTLLPQILPSAETAQPTEPTAAKDSAPTDTAAPAETPAPTESAIELPSLEDCVRDYVSDRIAYTDDLGNDYDASFAVPELLLASSDAKHANSYILSVCEPQLNESYAARDDGTSMFCMGIDYDAWIYDRWLSLTVHVTNDWGCDQYLVFTFDLTDGTQLDNADFAAYLGISEAELQEDMGAAMLREYDASFASAPDDLKDDFYYEQRERCGAQDNVLSAELYIDTDGTVGVHCDIFSIAGADSYEHLIPLYN